MSAPKPADSQYVADLPAKVDLFGRRPFANRVAETIVGRPLGEPLVVSIVGEWGSGKSTALEYVKDKLAQLPCKVAEFNPWRFGGEDVLLFELFSALVTAIDPDLKVLTKWQSIKGAIERRSEAFKQLASSAANLKVPGTGPLAGGLVTVLTNSLRTEIEEVRKQTREHLEKSEFRIVVLLDDIDRLDANDILTLFRLIKLTADLPNTTFVLALDEDHVSQIVGQRINGKQSTGRAYIEKIVNVRLALPVIPDYTLRGYTLGLLDAVLDGSGQKLADDEASRCRDIFDKLCSPVISTPRTAKSLANAYRFALGLLPGDVNPGDLMLLESTRLVRPELYKAIVDLVPRVMAGDSAANYLFTLFGDQKEKSKATEANWAQILSSVADVRESEREEIKQALGSWFPQLHQSNRGEEPEEWALQKRLCSKSYFWRYFSGTIQDDDVSDEIVSGWIGAVNPDTMPTSQAELAQHLNSPYAAAFVAKLRLAISRIESDSIGTLVWILAGVAKKTSDDGEGSFIGSLLDTTARLAAAATTSIGGEHAVVSTAVKAIAASSSFGWSRVFLDHLPEYCRTQGTKTENGVKWTPALVEQTLANKMLAEYRNQPPDSPNSICRTVWMIYRNIEPGKTREQVTQLVRDHSEFSLHFMAVGCTYSDTTGDPDRRWKWNGVKSVRELAEIADPVVLEHSVRSVLKDRSLPVDKSSGPLRDREYETLEGIGWRFLNHLERKCQPHSEDKAVPSCGNP